MTTAPATTVPKRRRNRRWLRLALPFAALLTLVGGTLLVHAIEQPDPTEASFLSPLSGDDDGADRLAARLRQRGVVVERLTTTPDALDAARSGPDTTLFVSAPGLVHPDYLRMLTLAPADTRIVLVAPTAAALGAAGLRVTIDRTRWTAAAPDPGCALPAASAAGPAAVHRQSFGPAPAEQFRCYAGGLIEVIHGNTSVTLVGAADPFRNDRSGEHGNQAFAVALLARSSRVIWLDLHEREIPPRVGKTPSGPATTETPEPDSTGDGFDEDDQEWIEQPATPTGKPNQGQAPTDDGAGNPLTDNPLARAFPPAMWAAVLLLALAALALAAASARRLGAPVAEPLPARVHATETVRGHARLYQRARARGPSLDTLRTAALHRIADHLGMPPDSTVDDVSAQAAVHTGHPAQQIRAVLGGDVPETDGDLVAAALAVQHLVRDVLAGPTT